MKKYFFNIATLAISIFMSSCSATYWSGSSFEGDDMYSTTPATTPIAVVAPVQSRTTYSTAPATVDYSYQRPDSYYQYQYVTDSDSLQSVVYDPATYSAEQIEEGVIVVDPLYASSTYGVWESDEDVATRVYVDYYDYDYGYRPWYWSGGLYSPPYYSSWYWGWGSPFYYSSWWGYPSYRPIYRPNYRPNNKPSGRPSNNIVTRPSSGGASTSTRGSSSSRYSRTSTTFNSSSSATRSSSSSTTTKSPSSSNNSSSSSRSSSVKSTAPVRPTSSSSSSSRSVSTPSTSSSSSSGSSSSSATRSSR